MTNTKTTKRALFASVLSLLLCISMLIGSTFAWFTDSATTGVNKIQSGNLDIVLSYKNATQTSWKEVSETDKLFDDNALWEPGYTEVAYLKIENSGSLALKYQLTVNVLNEVAGTNKDSGTIKLSEVLKYDLIELTGDTTYADRAAALTAVSDAKNLATETVSGIMEAKATAKYFALVVYMPTTTGNDANHKTGTTPPSIQLGVNVLATQYTAESDSYGSDYDTDAYFPLLANERRANNKAELTTLLAGDLTGVDTIYLGKGEFDAFALSANSTLKFIGSMDRNGNPTTVISMPAARADGSSNDTLGGVWNGYKGTVENVKFSAASSSSGKLCLQSVNYATVAGATFANCTFENVGVKVYGSATFTNCTFDGQNQAEKAIAYSVVPENEAIKLTGCVIKNYTSCGINIAESAGSLIVESSTLENCQASGEYGIHVGLIDTVRITGSTLKCDVHYYESLIKTFECDNNQFETGYSASKG